MVTLKKSLTRSLVMCMIIVQSGIVLVAQDQPKNYVFPRRPTKAIEIEVDQVYYELVNGTFDMDWNRLDGTLEYVQAEYDCSDFRLVNLVRILYEYGDKIPEVYMEKIAHVLFDFRYWWDDPGENSMCYWSENHQILFASAEYLVGQRYPDQVFPVSGLTGKEHMEKARIRAFDWLEMRWKYGFTEYYSNVYYKEDIGPLINLVDFSADDTLVKQCQMILDLLFYDVAAQSMDTLFVSVSGRAYRNNRTGIVDGDFGGLTNYFWGDGKEIEAGIMYGLMVTEKYQLPPVIKEIARDDRAVIIKQSNGLDLDELKEEGYYGTDNRSMMMQWGMEAFTNPIIIRNSIKHIRNTNMFSNEFVSGFRSINFFLLRWLHLEPAVSWILNPQYNGAAIQKGNTYTYRTKDYSMYTVQSHHPGEYAGQHHVFGMNIGSHFAIFHNHPAQEKESNESSPNYWVGYGHFPHAVQDENVNLSIYNIPERKGVMEAALLDYTRAFFPTELFDTAFIEGNYAFGKKGSTYCAFIASRFLEFRDEAKDDLILRGNRSFWITEAGSASEDGSFDSFISRVFNNTIRFDEETLELSYVSRGKTYELKFGRDFKLNGEVVDTQYNRYDAPYVQANKKDPTLTFECNGKSLFLDFENLVRQE